MFLHIIYLFVGGFVCFFLKCVCPLINKPHQFLCPRMTNYDTQIIMTIYGNTNE